MTTVKLISYQNPTEYLSKEGIKDALGLVAYCARVSNPSNQLNSETNEKLVKYLIKHQHWSPLEMVSACLEINTTRAIAAQVLRHRSFTFQEFSQRYADSSLLSEKIPLPELRRQDTKNRQNSIDDIDAFTRQKFEILMQHHFKEAMNLYQEMLDNNIAKECARNVLPLCVGTKMYMTGNLRNWIHYIQLRSANGTQKEHQDIALLVKQHFICQFPVISQALEWCSEGDCGCPAQLDVCNCIQPALRID